MYQRYKIYIDNTESIDKPKFYEELDDIFGYGPIIHADEVECCLEEIKSSTDSAVTTPDSSVDPLADISTESSAAISTDPLIETPIDPLADNSTDPLAENSTDPLADTSTDPLAPTSSDEEDNVQVKKKCKRSQDEILNTLKEILHKINDDEVTTKTQPGQ